MMSSLWEKIEKIRQEPEHIRVRYVMLSVSVSMVFIIGIWLLSVQDSVSTAIKDMPEAVEEGKNITGGAPSLNDLFEQSAPLRIENNGVEGSEFFDQELNKGGASGEGVTTP